MKPHYFHPEAAEEYAAAADYYFNIQPGLGGRELACEVALDLLCFCATGKAFGYDIGTGNSVD